MLWNGIREIEAPELAKWLGEQGEKPRVIDVRQMPEIAAGTVPGAEAVPLHTLPLRLPELGREEKLVVICRSGVRSAQACMFLAQQGYDNVYNLRGGMLAWTQTGLAVGTARNS